MSTPAHADKSNIRAFDDGYRKFITFIRPVAVKVSCKGHYKGYLLTCVPVPDNCHRCPKCGDICKEVY